MSGKALIAAGQVVSVYDDRWLVLLSKLGKVEITRATEVEWQPAYGVWAARELATGKTIAAGRNRAAVIAEEVEYLESKLGEL